MGDAANGIANDIPRCPRNHLLQESQNRQKIRFLSIGMEGGVRKPFFPHDFPQRPGVGCLEIQGFFCILETGRKADV